MRFELRLLSVAGLLLLLIVASCQQQSIAARHAIATHVAPQVVD